MKSNNSGLLINIIGNIASIVGCFLPFMSFLGFSTNYYEGDGKIVVVVSIIGILLALFKLKLTCIANIINLVIVFVAFKQASAYSITEMLDIGAYIIIVANIIAFIGSLMLKRNN